MPSTLLAPDPAVSTGPCDFESHRLALASVITAVTPSLRLVTIPASAEGRAVETIIFLLDPRVSPEGWPERDSMKTQLVGSFPLPSGSHVSVVWWEIPMPTIPPLQATLRFFRGAQHGRLEGR